MTKQEMIDFLHKNYNVKISHTTSTDDRYIFMNSEGLIETKEGYTMTMELFIRYKGDAVFNDGWHLVDDIN